MKIKEPAVFGAVCLAVAMTFLSGCRTVSNSGQHPAKTETSPGATILLRVTSIETNQQVTTPAAGFHLNAWRMTDADGRIEVSSKMFSPPGAKLSRAAVELGWSSFNLEPGTYCLEIVPAGNLYQTTETNGRPFFYLNILSNQPLAYVGTVVFRRHVEKFGNSWLHRTTETEFEMLDFKNETENAEQLAAKEFPELPKPAPCWLVPYDIPSAHSNSEVAEVRAGTGATPAVGRNQSYFDSVMTSPFMAPGVVLVAVASDSGDGGAYVGGAGLALMLVGAPLALSAEAIKAHADRKKWAPYQAALVTEVSKFNLNERLREQLSARLGGIHTNASAPAPFSLRVQPYRIFLRDYGKKKFALEVAVRVQLIDSANGRLLWEHNYSSGAKEPTLEFNRSETPVSTTVLPRRLEDFRGDSGAELIRSELQSAVDELTQEIARHI